MSEKFLKLIPKLSKNRPFFDNSSETICINVSAICRFMSEKFLKLIPRLSKIFPIFDTSGDNNNSCYDNITKRDRSSFLKSFMRLLFFSMPKITPISNTQFSNRNHKKSFLGFFWVKSYDGEKVSARKTTFLKQAEIR